MTGPRELGYADRWMWLKEMLRQPREALTDATKVVLVAIWEAMNRETGTTERYHATIAAAVGMSVDGVRGCIRRAREAGYVTVRGQGGIRKDDRGGIACEFRLSLPDEGSLASTGIKGEGGLANTGVRAGQHGEGSSASTGGWFGQPDNPLLLPLSSSPVSSPEGWPSEWADEVYPAHRGETAEVVIVNHAMRILQVGYPPPKENGVFLDVVVRRKLVEAGIMAGLVEKSAAGELSRMMLAIALKAMGYEPVLGEETSDAA